MSDFSLVIDKISDFFEGQFVCVNFHFENDQVVRDGFQTERFWVIDDVFFGDQSNLDSYIENELKDYTYF